MWRWRIVLNVFKRDQECLKRSMSPGYMAISITLMGRASACDCHDFSMLTLATQTESVTVINQVEKRLKPAAVLAYKSIRHPTRKQNPCSAGVSTLDGEIFACEAIPDTESQTRRDPKAK
ncbi:hypothetical protein LZ554_001587 [Drepanopeziza brunnea f. sp. 'monogermtubi']|nr:hypothetical protein LZ554_001587 [Drepanopeziza brunnea f. sp. 'monogermtubi']